MIPDLIWTSSISLYTRFFFKYNYIIYWILGSIWYIYVAGWRGTICYLGHQECDSEKELSPGLRYTQNKQMNDLPGAAITAG